MDFNFADLKKEAAATGEDIFNQTTNAAKETAAKASHDLLADDTKELDFEHVDPQTFVQRMSAGAKEAQEELDAKFATQQHSNDFDDFLTTTAKDLGSFGAQVQQDAKQGMASLTNDFMNAERFGGFGFGGGSANATANASASGVGVGGGAGDGLKEPVKPVATASVLEADLLGGDSFGAGDGRIEFPPTAPIVPAAASKHFYDDDDFTATSNFAKSSASTKDSDTDSPSVSYNPSPAKKNPVTDALKEQDNEKFISSEDLLSDFKDERTATPEYQTATVASAAAPIDMAKVAPSTVPTTDLDADLDDEHDSDDDARFVREVPATKHAPALDQDIKHAPTSAPAPSIAPVVVPQPKVEPIPTPTPTAAAPKPATVSEPARMQPAAKPASVVDVKAATPAAKQTKVQQPNIVSVEEIFYKYGLDAWFKPERLHPRVESLIYWRDVKKSGIVFGAGLLILLAISCCSVISVFAYVSLLTLAGTIVFRIYKSIMQAVQKTSEGHPFKEYLDLDLTLSQEKVQNIAGVAVAHVNGFTAELRRLFLVDDLVDSIKFGVILWVLTYIGAWFNGMTLVILAFVALFTLPKIYENNKQSIDTYLDLVRSKLTEITDKIKVAIPIGNKKPVAVETEKDK